MKNFKDLKHAPKSDFSARTTILLKPIQHEFIKRHNLNLSRIVRIEVDRLIKLWQKQSKKVGEK